MGAQLTEGLQTQTKRQGTHRSDDWRWRRVACTAHFMASLSLCSRCVDLLVGSVPAAHSSSSTSEPGSAGMDFWLDLIEPDGRRPTLVRISVLRLLLAVAT